MEQLVLLLVILSAFLHVYWNGLLKKSYDKHVFTWWFLLFSLIFFLLPALSLNEDINTRALQFAFFSGVLHSIYFLFLGYAYEEGELSFVYPIARSSPAIVPLLAYFLLCERVPIKGYFGIFLVVAGIFMLNLHEFSVLGMLGGLKILKLRATKIAILTALTTSFYSIVDKMGVSLMEPMIYIYIMFFFSFLGVSFFVLSFRKNLILCEFMMNKRYILISGILCMLSYLLILYAMRETYVSYIVALRQVGVLLSLFVAVVLLRERVGKWRIIASFTIFLGLVIISI
jgi:uncharacterized membrane protein